MDKIFEHADDLHVRKTIVYATEDDGYLFADSAHTDAKKLSKDEVKNLFLKGMAVVLSGAYYVPAAYYEGGSGASAYGAVTVCADAGNYNFFSKEHTI